MMATTNRTADGRAGLIVLLSFVSGLAFAMLVAGHAAFEPPPESSFQIDDVAVEAEQPPVEVVDELPPTAVLLAAKPAVEPPSPERLALADAPVPIAAAIVAQALPTSGEGTGDNDRDEPTPPPSTTLVPTPSPTAAVAVSEADPTPAMPEESPELRALVVRLQSDTRMAAVPQAHAAPAPSAPREPAVTTTPPRPPAPLPGDAWTDPEGNNWSEPPAAEQPPPPAVPPRSGRLLSKLVERRGDGDRPLTAGPHGPARLLDRVRDRIAQLQPEMAADEAVAQPATDAVPADGSRWPPPTTLDEQLRGVGTGQPPESIAAWSLATQQSLAGVLATAGPRDAEADASLIALGDRVTEGMQAADTTTDFALASRTRRAALAVARRVAVWRAAASCVAEATATNPTADVGPVAAVVEAVERFETTRDPADASRVRETVRLVAPLAGSAAIARAVHDHYRSPNVRLSVNERFIEKLLPETSVTTGPLHDYVLGRKVRGTKTVEQSIAVRLQPHPTEIRLELLVNGEVTSRTVTDAGSVAIHSRGLSTFTVSKPIQLTAQGLDFAAARGTASNQSRLAGIESDFDAVPLMGPLIRGIARSQHDENLDQATREVNVKIVSRACREVDQQTEPKLAEAATRIRERFWAPMERLGLEPTAVALETTEVAATARLRLAAATQLAAHTPRPRAPDDALFSIQVHESTVNNACDRFGLAGRKMSLEQLTHHVCTSLGLPPSVPDDLPEGVDVTFAQVDPLRVECRDGLVHVSVALDALESGRRNNWYEVAAHVAYRPVASGMQVLLERDGPVQLSGPGHRGRMEFGLRTIFGKMFPKERPVPLVPAKLISNPRLAGVQAVQAVSADGWLAIALAPVTQAGAGKPSATAARPVDGPARVLRR